MWWLLILAIALILIGLFILNFYRDPKRTIPKGNNIVAPADGTVINIVKVSKKNIKIKKGLIGKINALTKDIAKECYIISIFMSSFDVHINRAPISGTIKSVRHEKGKFFRADDIDKSLSNEKNEIIIQNKYIKVKVIQIAGFLARRILCYVSLNQKVNKGSKIGMIALGSQTTIILPTNIGLRIGLNSKVKAGETIIAELMR